MKKLRRIMLLQVVLVCAWITLTVFYPTIGSFIGFLAGYNSRRMEQWRKAMEISE